MLGALSSSLEYEDATEDVRSADAAQRAPRTVVRMPFDANIFDRLSSDPQSPT